VFPYAPESVGAARRLVQQALRTWDLASVEDNAVLVASELVTNAVQTGCRRGLHVVVARSGHAAIRIAVTDGSRSLPVLLGGDPPSGAERIPSGGRGLLVVASLSRHWGVEQLASGKTVFAELA
jgi:anti-sigma regulatory factor (Ser/Thr protein kinase)